MAIKFNPNLDYQNDAIAAITSLFAGQEIGYSNFTIYDPKKYQTQMSISEGTEQTEIGVANKLVLDSDDILKNLKETQLNNHLKASDKITGNEYNFAIEMETGTGKTYVYLKSIFELRKKYGFMKFIILVPSVAIKEGVLASLRMLTSHFDYHYKDFAFHYFQYSSDSLHQLMEFARSDKIEIMVMTIQSLDSDNKVLNTNSQKHLEKTNGVKPIDVINRTNPIVIIDEPQSTSASQSRKGYIKKLNPLCTLQYSATHKQEKNVHKVYRLTAVDAYIKKLVKQIEVASVIPKNDHNFAYVKLIEVKATKSKITAKIEIDRRDLKTGMVERKVISGIKPHDDLFDVSGRREVYSNMRIDKMTCNSGKQSIEINGKELLAEETMNSFDQDLLKRTQIRKTIEEHFEKEKRLNPKGIKVLSLFFIDKVANYRSWDGDNVIDGKFLTWFEEEYEQVRRKYECDRAIVSIKTPVNSVHQGYFAMDSKRHFKNTKGDSVDDIKAYESIMKDKEYLLSFENPIRFIFSHSALREGWDNPNVFQICTLNESAKSNDRKRQEIGRGLRICVNQDGERVYGFETNTLTVMANQSYEDFAKQLQTETEQDGGFKFGAIEYLSFAGITIQKDDVEVNMTEKESTDLFNFCKAKGYIDVDGKTTEKLKIDLNNRTVEIPQEFDKYKWDIIEYFKKVCGNLNIKTAENKVSYRLNKRVVDNNPIFEELWNRIKDKTKYSVQFDTEQLISDCVVKLKDLRVEGVEIEYRKAKISQNTTGIEGTMTGLEYEYISGRNRYLPDIISFLQNTTNLTRNTVLEMLNRSETLYMFYINPQRYMSDAAEIINNVLIKVVLQGIKYTKIAGEEFYLQEVFPDEELHGCLISELVKSDRSVYEYNRYDSTVERVFAKALQDDKRVIVYTKLPTKKFIVPTPLGDYTPDWAVVLDDNGEKKLYFVVETKGSTKEDDLRNTELLKIRFGEKRFLHVGGAGYVLASKHEDFKREVGKLLTMK
ncbi:MAG TPA: type III restriction endonuclease subunit R [Lachnospiraceae bacterium]|nr:type III restriction endonuclease subunit R [Lachnospiraceae bacterium]